MLHNYQEIRKGWKLDAPGTYDNVVPELMILS